MLPSTMVSLAELRGTVLPRGCPVFSGPKRLPAVVVGHSEFGPVLSTPLNDDAFICLAEPWSLAQREGGEPAIAWVDLMPWAVEALVVRYGASDEDRGARSADLQDRLPGVWWPSQAMGEHLVIRARSWCVTLRPRGERTRVRGGLIEIDRWPVGAMPVGTWPDGVSAGRLGEDIDAPVRLKARMVLAEALRQGALRDRGVGAVQASNRAPDRYSSKGRETIDRMRDLAHEMFADPALADAAFAFHCAATAVKYEDRAGLKGDAAVDEAKARWYREMERHALGLGEDPRSGRATFTPWTRHAVDDPEECEP